MNAEELKNKISEFFTAGTFDESGEWLTINVEPKDFLLLATGLRKIDALNFNYLFCLTCVDWTKHLTVVYHLSSTNYRHCLVIKVNVDRNKPAIETVSHIWKTAEFHEREVYEMFGVNFLNHPDLRLLILPDGWEGKFPMRKDFEDPINMIKL